MVSRAALVSDQGQNWVVERIDGGRPKANEDAEKLWGVSTDG